MSGRFHASAHQNTERPLGLAAAAIFSVVLAVAPASSLATEDPLLASFRHPPPSSRPWVHWQWVDGNISRAGITADLEALARTGIGGAILMDATHHIPEGTVAFGSPEWVRLVHFSAEEAARLGIQLGLHGSPGYTGLGGAWVTPQLSQQKLVWAVTNVAGPALFDSTLPGLPTFLGVNQDVAVLAFPALPGDGGRIPGLRPAITTDLPDTTGIDLLVDDNPVSSAVFPLKRSRGFWLQAKYNSPLTASRLRLVLGNATALSLSGTIQVSQDGRRFRDIRPFRFPGAGESVVSFEPTTGTYFRLQFNAVTTPDGKLRISDFDVAPVHAIPKFQAKSGLARRGEDAPIPTVPPEGVIHLTNIFDLTTSLEGQGRLRWEVPTGRWTILRLGSMPVGRNIPSARPGALGLEADRLNREAVTHHFQHFLEPLLPRAGSAARGAVTLAHVDSWESGFQNWTAKFPEAFWQRRGYDLRPWLPTFTGRIVEHPDLTERVLWDVRRTLADMFAEYFAAHLRELAHQRGLQLSIQSYFNGPFDDLQYGARADIPSAEFWNETDEDAKFAICKYMAAIGHTWGKPIISAEAFTAWPENGSWRNYPGVLKHLGDRALTEGINEFVFHRYAHQPWVSRQPGMTFGMWGIHYERTQTWWEYSRSWHEYLARCQWLLRQGLYVADVLYLTPEGAYTEPPPRGALEPPLPAGYHYDVAHPEVLMRRATAQNGRLLLPDGMSYRFLVLPPGRLMTPALLRRLVELVTAGVTIVGSPPLRSPSFSAYPDCDAEVVRLAQALWGDCDGQQIMENSYGQGQVVWGQSLETLLRRDDLPPDVEVLSPTDSPVRYIHRRLGDTNIYFVANSSWKPVQVTCRFRAPGRIPEIWDPMTGHAVRLASYEGDQRTTTIRLDLERAGSRFVLFREPFAGRPALHPELKLPHGVSAPCYLPDGSIGVSATNNFQWRGTTATGDALTGALSELPAALTLDAPWRVEFQGGIGPKGTVEFRKLVPWNEHPLADVKHFSGTAVYRSEINVPRQFFSPGRRTWLHLGEVQVIAQVRVNGIDFPPVWTKPFSVDVTLALRPGVNALEIRTANLWVNRLIGDEFQPEDADWGHLPPGKTGTGLVNWPDWLVANQPRPSGRKAFATWKFYTRDDALLPSGLLGPVSLQAVQDVRLAPGNSEK